MIYFASDTHFGAYFHQDPLAVERKFLRWLRILGKLADMADHGVEIHFFTGNHDIWVYDYLPKEIGCQVHRAPTTFELLGKKFYIAHGDEFIKDDRGFRIIRAIFHNRICQKLYGSLHPWLTVGFAHRWALHSRKKGLKDQYKQEYRGEKEEYLVDFAKEYLAEHPNDAPDFFIFGHRHIMLDLMLSRQSRVVILGDWITHFSYAQWDGTTFTLNLFEA